MRCVSVWELFLISGTILPMNTVCCFRMNGFTGRTMAGMMQISKEYTDWVWSDGSHPSIAIWDAINENTDNYIGNTLIPELKKLDPTRIWDAGYMREGL